jgi:hypothetical protein
MTLPRDTMLTFTSVIFHGSSRELTLRFLQNRLAAIGIAPRGVTEMLRRTTFATENAALIVHRLPPAVPTPEKSICVTTRVVWV